jgi:hypothetical protein
MFAFLKSLQGAPSTISHHNERVYYATEFLAALLFHIPVWVAFELQYINLGQLAMIEAIIQGSQLVAELPTGAVADLLGKRPSILIGRAIGVLGLLLYAQGKTFPDFCFYAVITGIGESFVSGAKEALMYDSLKQDKREAQYSKIAAKGSLFIQIGLASATLVGGVLSVWGYQIAIYASAVAGVIATWIGISFHEPYIDTEKFTLRRYVGHFKVGFSELFKSAYVRDISLFYLAVGGITWAAMMIFNTALLTTIGYSTFQIGIIAGITRIFNGVILFRALHVDSLLTKRRTYLWFPILMIASFLPGVFLTKGLAILAVTGAYIASTARWVILGGYVNEHYTSKNRATAISTLSMLVSLCVVGVAFLSGPIMNAFGGVPAMYTVLGIASLVIVLPLGLRIRSRYHRE